MQHRFLFLLNFISRVTFSEKKVRTRSFSNRSSKFEKCAGTGEWFRAVRDEDCELQTEQAAFVPPRTVNTGWQSYRNLSDWNFYDTYIASHTRNCKTNQLIAVHVLDRLWICFIVHQSLDTVILQYY